MTNWFRDGQMTLRSSATTSRRNRTSRLGSETRAGRASRTAVARLRRFLREVVAELRKVIWPTRRQLVTYTLVVLVFVSFMVALVAGFDTVFQMAVAFLFGN